MRKSLDINKLFEKEFKDYKIKICTFLDSIIISVIKRNLNILFQNIFSLNYLQSFKLFKGKYMIKEIFKFIISLIDKNSFQIEENKLKIKFILTSMNN